MRTSAGRSSRATRAPSSNAARSRAALVGPIPGARSSSAAGRCVRRRSDPSATPSSRPATSRTSEPPFPVPIRIARSSAVVNADAPRAQSRSRGRSDSAREDTWRRTPQDGEGPGRNRCRYPATGTELTPEAAAALERVAPPTGIVEQAIFRARARSRSRAPRRRPDGPYEWVESDRRHVSPTRLGSSGP